MPGSHRIEAFAGPEPSAKQTQTRDSSAQLIDAKLVAGHAPAAGGPGTAIAFHPTVRRHSPGKRRRTTNDERRTTNDDATSKLSGPRRYKPRLANKTTKQGFPMHSQLTTSFRILGIVATILSAATSHAGEAGTGAEASKDVILLASNSNFANGAFDLSDQPHQATESPAPRSETRPESANTGSTSRGNGYVSNLAPASSPTGWSPGSGLGGGGGGNPLLLVAYSHLLY